MIVMIRLVAINAEKQLLKIANPQNLINFLRSLS
jgi:hypothetical protein